MFLKFVLTWVFIISLELMLQIFKLIFLIVTDQKELRIIYLFLFII